MRKSKVKKELNNLKECIYIGHQFKLKYHWRHSPEEFLGDWRCKVCGYTLMTTLSPKQIQTIKDYEDLKPPPLPDKA